MDAAGRFRFELLRPGKYRVYARAGAARRGREIEVDVTRGALTSVSPGLLGPRSGASDAASR